MEKMRRGNIELIPGKNQGRYPYCNSIFIDEGPGIVIDPASDEERLMAMKINPGIGIIINTHYHEDHFLYNHHFPEAELWVPERDAPAFESLETILDYCGLLRLPDEETWRSYYLDKFNYRARKPERKLKGDEKLQFGKTRVEVIHTPGHTPGHTCFWFPDERILFLSDYDLTAFGPWYGDRVSSLEDTIASIEKLRKIPAEVYWVSHGEEIPQVKIAERFEEYLRVIVAREEKLLTFLKNPHSLDEIVEQWIIYRKEREPIYFFKFAEQAMVKKHLENLVRRGLIRTEGLAGKEKHFFVKS
jgi:hydroxyacylglutathione hydrolase